MTICREYSISISAYQTAYFSPQGSGNSLDDIPPCEHSYGYAIVPFGVPLYV